MDSFQILAADPPKWTDIGQFWALVAAAIFAAVAAGFAGYAAFRQHKEVQQQQRQIRELARREQLSDRILRYQAYLNARAVIDGVKVTLSGNATEWSVNIQNESFNVLRDLMVGVFVDGTPLELTGQTDLLRTSANGWTGLGGPTVPSPQVAVLKSGEGRMWHWRSDFAANTDAVTLRLQLTDMVGGRWAFNASGAGVLLDDDGEHMFD